MQRFDEVDSGDWQATLSWPIDGWFGQSLQNKPYLDVSSNGQVCVTDPEGYRVLCFDRDGEFLVGWGDIGSGAGQFDIPVGLAFDGEELWVVDHGNARLMEFSPFNQ